MSWVKASDGLWLPHWSALVLRLFGFSYSFGLKIERSIYNTSTALGKNAIFRPMNFCLLGKGIEESCTPGICTTRVDVREENRSDNDTTLSF